MRTEAELISIGSSISSEASKSGSSLSVSDVCSVCSETNELSVESSACSSADSAECNECDECNECKDDVVDADTGLFCAKLYKKHRAEAAAYVEKCRREGKNPLDACGERGDLFFLIQSEWGMLFE